MAKKHIKSKEKGFTIIEVVLVLAIAGLIFLMVFVALPALQRSQRDTQRRNDMTRVDTALANYQTNNSSTTNVTNLPEPAAGGAKWTAPDDRTFGEEGCGDNIACSFIRDYMNSGVDSDNAKPNTFEDPSGEPYNLVILPNVKTNAAALAATYTGTDNAGHSVKMTNGTIVNEAGAFEAHTVFIVPGGKCNGEKAEVSSKNDSAVLYRLEGSGVYCIDNQ